MAEFTNESRENNGGYDFTADFDQIGRYLSGVSDGVAFRSCIEDIMDSCLPETEFKNDDLFVDSKLELDLPDGRIACLTKFGSQEIAAPSVAVFDIINPSYERYTVGDDGILVRHSSSQQAEAIDESASAEEQRAHYLKITKGQPLGEGEVNNLLGLLREGRPR